MSTSPTRELADHLVQRILEADPFGGTALGMREYDALVPDPSEAAEQALAADLAAIDAEASALQPDTDADRVTQAVIRTSCARQRQSIEAREVEYTVTPMPLAGPPALFALVARTTLPDAGAAGDYVTRLRAAPAWLDGSTDRLRAGAARGMVPIGSLVDKALAWADAALAEPVPAAFTAPRPPQGWDGADEWQRARDAVVTQEIRPAVARWREVLAELRPGSRHDDRPGVCALPDGDATYANAIGYHTTLELTADELHRTGVDEITRLEERALALGATIGLGNLAAINTAIRASASELDAGTALAAARAAIARAEARAAEIMPAPLPPPCAVEPMPLTVAESGIAPHYTRPVQDGSRPGTFWFNTLRPTAGTGWDLEAVAFHEAVPGHHSQLARAQLLADLPLLQQLTVTVHAEGWGLYAERLAGEFGLYSDARAELGAVTASLLRAARLVVDTGLHALGWSRARAVEYMIEHVPMPAGFLADEIDRYLAWPGQALAYLTGLREIVRLRESAQAAIGPAFDLPAFNGVMLDSGSVPMPVLAAIVDRWVEQRG